jgi:hypothetical protein
MSDQEQARAGKGSHEAKDAKQDHPKGHQHSQNDMPSRERGASHRRRRTGQKVGNP